ncbi:hypothetical protein HBA55_35490 [Pseudomaricurvus alkylphenolicus]|jgi:hypothetical protein|uniref:hypothetical protein n=1 Tax=Pseudomaricurvus alkylphenolicus TaxID=1306991 RepID=UPI0014204141|nr:hypothetical protein [Pseudomaricurvus alkylphenolicus]NIB44937.1 hypothetical protein [Pseudomaricurvus alkylphenolicus]
MSRNWILVLAAVVLMVVSSAATLVVFEFSGHQSGDSYGAAVPRRFDVFEGYNQCQIAVEEAIPGRVLSVEGDDRAAKYQRITNMNVLFFTVDYSESGSGFAGEMQRIYALCEVSAETNRIMAVKLRPSDEKEFTEVRRRE